MKKFRFFAIILLILMLFNALSFVSYADNSQNETEQNKTLNEADLPETLSLEQARASGHKKRLPSREDKMNTAVFENEDGTETLYLFDEDIKYTDKNGQVFDKSNKLTAETDGTFRNRSNDISVTYPNLISNGVLVDYNAFSLRLVPVSSQISTGTRYGDNENKVSYQNAFGVGTTLRYTQTFSGFKEDIILHSPPLKSAFEFLVYTESALLKDSSGRIIAYVDGEKIGEFGDVVIYDANEVYAYGTSDLSCVRQGVYKITLNVPEMLK